MNRYILATGLGIVLLTVNVRAQEKQSWKESRSLFSFNAGVSIPIVCYASDNVYNKFAGFAKPGFTFDFTYGYHFGENVGIAASIFFAGNKINEAVVRSPGGQGYRYYGVVLGPMVSKNFSTRWDGDLRFMAGISRVRAPKLVSGDATILNKDEAIAFTWSAGAGLRYSLNNNSFLSFRADQTQLKPKFNSEGAQKGEQHIVVVNLDAGMGIKW